MASAPPVFRLRFAGVFGAAPGSGKSVSEDFSNGSWSRCPSWPCMEVLPCLLWSILFHGAFAAVLVVGQSCIQIVSRFSHGVSSPGWELHAAHTRQRIAKLLPVGRVNPVDLENQMRRPRMSSKQLRLKRLSSSSAVDR